MNIREQIEERGGFTPCPPMQLKAAMPSVM